jgi:uncharacterized oligopeptide transporter (OPT) family protein
VWQRNHRKSADQVGMPLASGLIAGEAIMAIIIPILIAAGLLIANPSRIHDWPVGDLIKSLTHQ